MLDKEIKKRLHKILREENSPIENRVYSMLKPLANMELDEVKNNQGIELDEQGAKPPKKHKNQERNKTAIVRPPFVRLLEKMPLNPKKSFDIYKRVYDSLTHGAPSLSDVKKMWQEDYSKSKNIIIFVRKIAKFIHKHYGEKTEELMK